ncbi:GPP34 family phosphoprotein [Streptomyces longwoodensis]|uniref:GOLPH3/VPS74 family protein n=1 Tax=Streptomyces longwoodensis TaxID=68231 RepID=UPI002ED41B64|nr:GPP34 family phosphoprotein [Streptomyces longwoodensis]
MTTAQDLLIVALDEPSSRPVAQGDLSLALAGAEVLDLLDAGALSLDGDRLVPFGERPTGDPMLDEASASLVREEPYETVEDWLWRRGNGLAARYATALEAEGRGAGAPRRLLPRLGGRTERADSAARHRAGERWAVREPVLATLAATLGIQEAPVGAPDDADPAEGDALTLVSATVEDALTELEAVRQRRRIEDDAFANVWRAP